MGSSNKRKTISEGFSLDPLVSKGIREIAKDLDVPRSRLVNYIFQQVLLAMTNPKIKTDDQEYKKLAARNRTLMLAGYGVQKWSIALDLEFVDREE